MALRVSARAVCVHSCNEKAMVNRLAVGEGRPEESWCHHEGRAVGPHRDCLTRSGHDSRSPVSSPVSRRPSSRAVIHHYALLSSSSARPDCSIVASPTERTLAAWRLPFLQCRFSGRWCSRVSGLHSLSSLTKLKLTCVSDITEEATPC